ncbi:MAG: DNA-binding MarR family transcriptional regulator [Pseudohongiellaceae bacterium]|jgi:DNA-binding MarR family transcriptional regulator
MPKFDKPMQLLLDLVTAQTHVQKRVDQHLFLHGISLSEFMVMRSLSLAADRSLRRIDLAEQVGLTASGITRLIAPMEKNNLVTKQANARDARVSLVKLTDVGAEIFSDASTSFKIATQSVFENLTQADLDAVAQAISRLK